MKAFPLVVVLAGCGRFGFDPGGDAIDSGSDVQPLIVPITDNALDGVVDIAFDSSGGFAVTGDFTNTLTVGAMSRTETASLGLDLYVAAFDAAGAPRWLWSPDASVLGNGQNLAWLPDGRLYVVGYFGGTVASAGNLDAGGGQDTLQLWLTPAGTLDHAVNVGGSANDQMRGMGHVADLFAFGGTYASTINFGQGALPATTGGVDNAFLAAGDVTNGVTASTAFTAGGDVAINDVAIDAAGRICIGGRLTATTNFGGGPVSPGPASSGFVARFGPGLSYAWARELDFANVQAVGFATNGDCIAGGLTSGAFTIDGLSVPEAGGNDGFVMRFADADGHAVWVQTFAGAGDDTVFSLVPYDLDRVAVAGHFTGSAMLAGTPEVSDGDRDGFITALDKDGAVIWTQLLAGSGTLPDTLSGMDVDLAHRKLGLAAAFNGELRVGSAAITRGVDTGVAIVVPLPP